MRAQRISLNVSENFSEGLKAVCDHLGVSKSCFIEDFMAAIVEDFLSDLEGSGSGPLCEYITDRSWSRKDAERMAGILRGLPRPTMGVKVCESKTNPGLWEVQTTNKEVA